MRRASSFDLSSWAWLTLVSIVVGSTGCSFSKEKVAKRKMGRVEKADVVQLTTLNGTVRGVRQSQVQPGYSGYIGKVFVKVGTKVKAGDPLVSLLQTINQPLNEVFPIRAPFAGTVTQVLQREGEYVGAASGSGANLNSMLMVIDDLSELWIDVNIPEVDIAKVSVGLEAQVKASALQGNVYQARVEGMSISAKQSNDRWDRGRVEYPAELRILNPDSNLRPGMTVVVDVISAKVENVLTIRHEFVHREKNQIFLVDEQDEHHEIVLGLTNEDVAEIKSGVEEGLKVKMKDFSQL